MLQGLVARIGRFNAARPWSHNDFYHPWVLRQLPHGLSRTIDLGCGTGNLVRAISARTLAAEGIDADAGIIAVAQQGSGYRANVAFAVGNVLGFAPAGRYDAVTAIAVIHHLPLEAILEKARSLLAPRGILVVIGCYRPATTVDHAVGVLAVPANMAMGLWKAPGRDAARAAMSARTAEPRTSLREVRAAAARTLPGATVRRRLFWRYSLSWKAPASP